MSPDFCYRIDLLDTSADRGAASRAAAQPAAMRTSGAAAVHPLSNYALANRLSYFLWSSMPDPELLSHAAAGDLQKPEVLTAQARRMMKDEKALGLATEFGGNWLDFRHFETSTASIASASPASTTNCARPCSRSPSGSSRT